MRQPRLGPVIAALAVGLVAACEGPGALGGVDGTHGQGPPPWSAGAGSLERPIARPGEPDAGFAVPPSPARLAFVSDGAHDRVLVVDLVGLRVQDTIAVGQGPRPVAVSPDGDLVFVGNNTDGTISVIGTQAERVIDTLPLRGIHPNAIVVHPDGDRLFTGTTAGLEEVPIDPSRRGRVLPDLGPTAGLALSPDGELLYVATDFLGAALAVIDARAFVRLRTVAGFAGAASVVTDDAGRVYVADERRPRIAVLGPGASTMLREVPVVGAPFGLSVSADGAFAFVGHELTAPVRLEAVDLFGEAREHVQAIPPEGGVIPTFARDGAGTVYAPGFMAGDLYVLDEESRQLRARVPIDGVTWGVGLVR